MFQQDDTIVALATPSGSGAIGVIRLSGPEAIRITQQVFKGKDLSKTLQAYTANKQTQGMLKGRFLSLIKKNPNVNFIIPHLGGLLPLYSLNDGYGEIFTKTIFLSSVSSSLDMIPICISVMPKNISFATDFPFNHDCSVLNSLSTCREIINKKNYEDFFYGNINKFMNKIWG